MYEEEESLSEVMVWKVALSNEVENGMSGCNVVRNEITGS